MRENRMEQPDIRSMYPEELKERMVQLGEKPFRGAQLFSWLHQKLADSYDQMSDLPAGLRQKLEEQYPLRLPEAVDAQISKLDGTRKYLFRLYDGNVIESVWMRYHHGNSVCVSSQAGCRMGCRFCASTLDGLSRSLQASEMLGQVYQIQKLTGERVSNIVVMGSGEPLDNYENLIRFLKLVSAPEGLNISQRSLTVSTCGLGPEMYRLAEEGLQVTLALSLHASSDEKRKKLMPIANRYSLEQVLGACRNYFEKTGRRITFEYALAAGENDGEEDAGELGDLLAGFPCHVNLIPINPVKERKFRRSGKKMVVNFQNKLEKRGINVTIRREMGGDIDGACGQLRKRFMDNQEKNL